LRDTNESVLAQQNEALQGAYDSSMRNYQTGQARQLQAGQDLANTANTYGNANRAQLGFQNTLGTQQQNQTQQNLDTAYGDFNKQQQYPLDMLNYLNATIRGYQPDASKTAYASTPIGGNAASPLSTISSALGQFIGSTPTR
jgi:hypothetical protein